MAWASRHGGCRATGFSVMTWNWCLDTRERHSLVSNGSRPGFRVTTRPGVGQGKMLSRLGQACRVARRACDAWRLGSQRATTQCAMRATHAHCAQDPVLGLGHCFGSLFMYTVH